MVVASPDSHYSSLSVYYCFRFRSKTPNPTDHRSRAHSLQNNLNQPPSSSFPGATSFENSTPMPSQPNPFTGQPGFKEQWLTLDVSLRRGEQGFGFRIVGGPEEGTQVTSKNFKFLKI